MLNGLFLFNSVNEALGRLEGRNVVGGNGHSGFAGDVAGSLLSAMLDDEAAEATHVNGVASDKGTLNHIGEFFDNGQYLCLFKTGSLSYFVYDPSAKLD